MNIRALLFVEAAFVVAVGVVFVALFVAAAARAQGQFLYRLEARAWILGTRNCG